MRNKIITAVLILLAGLAIGAYISQENQIKDRLREQTYDLEHELEESRKRLRESEAIRHHLSRTIDSLISASLDLRKQLKERDREIIKIRGRYNEVNNDSLSRLMDYRAWKNGR